MSVYITLDTGSIQEQITRLRNRMPEAVRRASKRAFSRIKNVAVARSKDNCPISPTKGQYEAGMKKGWLTTTKRVGNTSISNTRMVGAKRVGASTRIRFDKNGKVLIGSSKLRSKRYFNPGTLTASIEGESGDFYARIFTNQDSAGYANYIHDGGPSGSGDWRNRGPGTVAKGSQADDKFIERAVNTLKDEGCDILRDEIERELANV